MAGYWHKTKKLRQGLVVFLVSLLFTGALAETYLRMFRPVFGKKASFVYDRALGLPRKAHDPGITNALGFKDRERSFSKPVATYRIVGLGDSFAWGIVPVEETYSAVLETRLNGAAPQ